MIDVIYLLGKGSPWQDNELRFSLRSLEKHCRGFRNVFVVGHKPEFLNDKIIHVPYQDIYSNKSRNIMSKVYWMCNDERMSQEFVMLNDDYFFLKETDLLNYPYYWKCDLQHTIEIQHNDYTKYVKATLECLRGANLSTKNFDVHRPITFNKARFQRMCNQFNWHIPHGYIVKSMYCNFFNIEGVQEDDVKLSRPYNLKQIETVLSRLPMFSIGDPALNQHMKQFITKQFTEKSSYER